MLYESKNQTTKFVILVYLEWFRRNSFLKCVLQPKIAEKSKSVSIATVFMLDEPIVVK